jgi:urea transport system substrate-binding protein
MVDQYRLLRPLGRGGTGIVCAAEDTSLGRRVAIKLLPCSSRSGADPSWPPCEIQFAGQLKHPHVVFLHTAGRYTGGVYLVMELMEGPSIQALVDEGPFPWREATAVLSAACEGLRAVHARGIIHCDLKPANLLRSAHGTIKLTDFGLARWLGPSQRSVSRKRVVGTPHYMSPEQCRAEECDERTDIYALGATYYTLLTGRTPYADASPAQIMFHQCSALVPDPRRHDPMIPRACAEIVRRAMGKKRAERYDSAQAMQDALQAVLLGRSQEWPI